jgi:hypothetical protein
MVAMSLWQLPIGALYSTYLALSYLRQKQQYINIYIMSELRIGVTRLDEYNPEDAVGIGRLMPFLSGRLSGEPMAEALLKEIIASPHHEQFVARLEGIIVGAATLSILMGPAVNKEGYLSDFVADPNIKGARIGHKIWEEMISWCEGHNIDLAFTSRSTRKKLINFMKIMVLRYAQLLFFMFLLSKIPSE